MSLSSTAWLAQCFLPQSVSHEAKKKKIVNCGVVAFTLERYVRIAREFQRKYYVLRGKQSIVSRTISC